MKNRDDEFSKRLAATLDDSVDALDADTRARLTALRRNALTQNRSRRMAGGLALAASLVALLLAPRLLQHPEIAAMKDYSEDMAYLSVDPQLLDDMDMLQAMDELQGAEEPAPAKDSSRGES